MTPKHLFFGMNGLDIQDSLWCAAYIVKNSNDHTLRSRQISTSPGFTCVVCSQGKLIIRISFTKIMFESPAFLECIQGDICGPIHPPNGPFRYFMVLIDAST